MVQLNQQDENVQFQCNYYQKVRMNVETQQSGACEIKWWNSKSIDFYSPLRDFPFKIKIPSLGCFILQKVTILSNTVCSSKTLRSIIFFLKSTKTLQLLSKLVLR